MADQTIRFNGYPFLEKEDKEDDDHAYVESSEWRRLMR
jgi:chloride channel 3/4/5